jgi:hypothetical protein
VQVSGGSRVSSRVAAIKFPRQGIRQLLRRSRSNLQQAVALRDDIKPHARDLTESRASVYTLERIRAAQSGIDLVSAVQIRCLGMQAPLGRTQ